MMNLTKVNLNELNQEARHLFETSDQGALNDFFETCETIEEINKTSLELKKYYPDLFETEE